MSPLLLALMLVAAGPDAGTGASPREARPSATAPAPQRPVYLPGYSGARQRPPGALSQRLQAVRQRYAGQRPAPSPIEEAQQRRRREQERPLPEGSLGALSRRVELGQRTFPSRDDRRLGSQARRELLSRSPARRVRRPRR